MSLNNVKVVKKDGTKEEFNVQKVVVAVNKSAYRALIKFSQKDIDFICHFVEEKVEEYFKKILDANKVRHYGKTLM